MASSPRLLDTSLASLHEEYRVTPNLLFAHAQIASILLHADACFSVALALSLAEPDPLSLREGLLGTYCIENSKLHM